jgi:O-antigen ligase
LTWDAIQSRLWTGYGYGAFWSNPWGPATEIWDALNWQVPSSHSGVLELWLALGAIGVALFAALVVRTFRGIIAEASSGRREHCLWLIGYFFIFVVHAATEPSMMEQTSISWVLFVALGCVAGPRVVAGAPVTTDHRHDAQTGGRGAGAARGGWPQGALSGDPRAGRRAPWRRP